MKPRLAHALFAATLLLSAALRAGTPLSPVFEDKNLADWRRQAFSDHASHGVLLRQAEGLLAWRLRSAAAFGSLAAGPHEAKDLFDLHLEFIIEGEAQPRFAGPVDSFDSYPRWAEEKVVDGPLSAEAALFFTATDVVVGAANVRNIGAKPLRVRPRLRIQRRSAGLRAQVLQANTTPTLQFSLDRSAAVGRPLVEHVILRMEGQRGRTAWLWPGLLKPLDIGQAQPLPDGRPLDLELTWPAPQLMAPGQTLRVPVLLAWGPQADKLQQAAAEHWRDQALPPGKAWQAVKNRWAGTKRRMPVVEAGRQRLLARALLDLLMADYEPRLGLGGDRFSAQKGMRDAFFSVDAPLAALGWAEIDLERAQASLLDLASFSAAAPAPLPPYTGEEKLDWEAAGLPLHALAAWELYHRDPQMPRAGTFLSRFGERLRNESAWWPGARDGDGNGLYAFARDEEMPPYLQRQQAPRPGLEAPVGVEGEAVPSLQTWSLALSSLVAWQLQAAAALAGAAGIQEEADRLMAQSLKTRHALQAEAWDPEAQSYRRGLDAMWMLLLGLEDDTARAQTWLTQTLIPSLKAGSKPWIEQGYETPWRFYFMARMLASYGHFEAERELTGRFLDEMDQKPVFDYEFGLNTAQWQGGSVATAAAISQLILQRHEQEVFLTSETGEFSAPMLQFRTIDGNFYMKRYRLPEKVGKYADIKVETPKNGKILAENSFIFSSDETLSIQIQSEWPMDITDLNRKAPIFRQSRRVELLVRPKTRIQVRLFPPSEAK